MKCLECGKEIDYYLQIGIIEQIENEGWVQMVYYPLQGCEECIPENDGIWVE